MAQSSQNFMKHGKSNCMCQKAVSWSDVISLPSDKLPEWQEAALSLPDNQHGTWAPGNNGH